VRALRTELAGALADPGADVRIRVAALGALVRGGTKAQSRHAWRTAATDGDAGLRRRAAELAPRVATPDTVALLALLTDDDALVREAACFAAGEIPWPEADRDAVVAVLVADAADGDALVREAAVAALGALGDPAGLPAVLTACADRPAVRRRAVLALASFDGPEVEAALGRALEDPDWQTRQAAEDLTVRPAD
jgi:HEAT repeat protein